MPPPRLPPDHARTKRQREAVAAGRNPLTRGPKHPDAPDDTSPTDRYPRPGTCGTCVFKTQLEQGVKRTTHRDGTVTEAPKLVLKCGFDRGRRISRGPATDIRAWWPGCGDYEPS